ncbi:MAG: hypothetical protein HW421_4071 [Ignavibacteria bacterium]|nr:hypothetical protein [Ignavibacteria bacterium]
MERLIEIEGIISNLSENELKRFREWFDEFDSANWDKQFENDSISGNLDDLGNKALADYYSNKAKEI